MLHVLENIGDSVSITSVVNIERLLLASSSCISQNNNLHNFNAHNADIMDVDVAILKGCGFISQD